MSNPIETVRLSNQAREQLIKLKRVTGLQQWNVLCRWAFVTSLREPTIPPPIRIQTDSPIDMSWATFGGRYEALYLALLKQRCHRDGLDTDPRTLDQQFKLHLHRGIGYLSADRELTTIADLLRKALHPSDEDQRHALLLSHPPSEDGPDADGALEAT